MFVPKYENLNGLKNTITYRLYIRQKTKANFSKTIGKTKKTYPKELQALLEHTFKKAILKFTRLTIWFSSASPTLFPMRKQFP